MPNKYGQLVQGNKQPNETLEDKNSCGDQVTFLAI